MLKQFRTLPVACWEQQAHNSNANEKHHTVLESHFTILSYSTTWDFKSQKSQELPCEPQPSVERALSAICFLLWSIQSWLPRNSHWESLPTNWDPSSSELSMPCPSDSGTEIVSTHACPHHVMGIMQWRAYIPSLLTRQDTMRTFSKPSELLLSIIGITSKARMPI